MLELQECVAMPVIFYMGAEDLNSGPYGCTACALTLWAISAAWAAISGVKMKGVKQAAIPTHVL